MTDISLDSVLKQDENIYASVVVMGRRARQITDQQKILIDMDKTVPSIQDSKENEDFDEVEIDREALLREHKILPKPTRVAIEEMQENKIRHETTSQE
jgi:DNA-directed RNA polymerase subunit K/omega